MFVPGGIVRSTTATLYPGKPAEPVEPVEPSCIVLRAVYALACYWELDEEGFPTSTLGHTQRQRQKQS